MKKNILHLYKYFALILGVVIMSLNAWTSCVSLPASYRTYNYGALTLRKELVGKIPHYEGWPGYDQSQNVIDKEENEIMYFSSPESGIAAWWAWFDRKNFNYNSFVTFRQIAQIYGDNIKGKINVYIDQWTTLSERYFGHRLKDNEKIFLNNKQQRWALAQTMFLHEAGFECPLPFDQRTFERGLRLARDHLRKRDKVSMKSDINVKAYSYDD